MRRKSVLVLTILLMVVGFAAVSTTLYLNGNTNVASNINDFDVYFSRVSENGVENHSLIQDKTHIAFETELSQVGEKYVLDYEVTNASKQYDAILTINCTGGNEYLRVENKFNVTNALKAREVRVGSLTVTVIQSTLEEHSFTISCEINGNAVDRNQAGGNEINFETPDYLAEYPGESLADTEYEKFIADLYGSYDEYERQHTEACNRELTTSCISFFQESAKKEIDWWKKNNGSGWRPAFQSLATIIENLTIKNNNEIPTNAIESWDASSKKNGSIMAYVLDENNNGMYELYLGQNGGVLAPPNSSLLFAGFASTLTEIKGLENLNTSNVTTMELMFFECSQVTNLDISSFDTSNVTNMNRMFKWCESLTSLTLGKVNTSNVTDMVSMFESCESLTSIDVSGFDTSKVTDMSGMFYLCNSLTSLDVSGFDTSKVTSMSRIFYGCRSLKSLDVKNFNTSNVKDMVSMFESCESLTSIDVSGFDTKNVKNIDRMFMSCKGITTLDLNGFDTSNVVGISWMFTYCSNLTTIEGLENFDTTNVTDMENLFSGCTKLNATITIKGTKCTSYEEMFKNAATADGAKIIVNYTSDALDLLNKMIATKSSSSNVVKGTVVV